jgi:ketosteroid isomerase-like protein
MDGALSRAFNAHDLDRLMALFAEDLEFYHDVDGLQRRAEVADGFRGLFARNDGIRRELVPGSLEVHDIPGFGAVEIGAHRFCHEEGGRADCGTFRFVHVWRMKDGDWKITRVVSYGH